MVADRATLAEASHGFTAIAELLSYLPADDSMTHT